MFETLETLCLLTLEKTLLFRTMDNAEKETAETLEEQKSILEEDRILLEAYSHSVDEEKIDHDLILCLLGRISASQEEGRCIISFVYK